MKRFLKILFVLLLFTGTEAYGQLIHRPEVGARPLGMGGAYTAVADDANAIFYNPAGLGFLNNGGVSLMHWRLASVSQMSLNHLSAYYGVGPGTVGFSWTHQSAELEEGPMNRTSTMSENNMLLSYGIALNSRTAVGLNVSRFMIDSKLGGGAGLGFDFGAMYKAVTDPVLWTIGVNAKNIAANLKNESLNSIYNLGTAVKYTTNDDVHSIIGSMDLQGRKDVNSTKGTSLHYAAGLEYSLIYNENSFALRGGVNGGVGYGMAFNNFDLETHGDGDFRLRSFSLGGGYGYDFFQINYAYVLMNENTIGDSHRIGVKFLF